MSEDFVKFESEFNAAWDYLQAVRRHFPNPQVARKDVVEALEAARQAGDERQVHLKTAELDAWKRNADIARRLNQLYVIMLWAICEGRFADDLNRKRTSATSGSDTKYKGSKAVERELSWLEGCETQTLTLECLRRLRNATAHQSLGLIDAVDCDCVVDNWLPAENLAEGGGSKLKTKEEREKWSKCHGRATRDVDDGRGHKRKVSSNCTHWTCLVLSIFIERCVLEDDGYLKESKELFKIRQGRPLGIVDVPIGQDPENDLVNGHERDWYFNLDKSWILGALKEGVLKYARKFYNVGESGQTT